MHWDTAAFAALIGAVTGWFVPVLIGRLPEPVTEVGSEPESEAGVEADEAAGTGTQAADDPWAEKIPYAVLAAAPGLAWKCALATALTAGLVGAQVGWSWPLAWLLYLCPIGVALAYIDFRTWLLPTRLIVPSYSIVISLILVASVATGDTDDLVRAGIGLVVARGMFWLLWFMPHGLNLRLFTLAFVLEVVILVVVARIGELNGVVVAIALVAALVGFAAMLWSMPKGGMGFGDVRLATLLGMALGFLGWGELVAGLFLAFVLGSSGWIPLRLLRITKSRRFPFGPFMLVGALLGVLWGAEIADFLTSGQS